MGKCPMCGCKRAPIQEQKKRWGLSPEQIDALRANWPRDAAWLMAYLVAFLFIGPHLLRFLHSIGVN